MFSQGGQLALVTKPGANRLRKLLYAIRRGAGFSCITLQLILWACGLVGFDFFMLWDTASASGGVVSSAASSNLMHVLYIEKAVAAEVLGPVHGVTCLAWQLSQCGGLHECQDSSACQRNGCGANRPA